MTNKCIIVLEQILQITNIHYVNAIVNFETKKILGMSDKSDYEFLLHILNNLVTSRYKFIHGNKFMHGNNLFAKF